MSTDYKLEEEVRFEHLLDGRLEQYGIHVHEIEETETGTYCVLTDGHNQISVYGDENVQIIKRCGLNNEALIIHAICRAFQSQAYSEFEPQYWGYETEEEWMAAAQYLDEHGDEVYCTQLLWILEKGDIPSDANERMLKDLAIIEEILCEFPDLSSKEHLLELVEQLIRRRDEERDLLHALFAADNDAPKDDLVTGIINQVKQRKSQKN